MSLSPQFKSALLRALGAATLAALGALAVALGTDASWREVMSVTLGAFAGAAAWRSLGEGLYDQGREARGEVRPGDVGAAANGKPPPPAPPSRPEPTIGHHHD